MGPRPPSTAEYSDAPGDACPLDGSTPATGAPSALEHARVVRELAEYKERLEAEWKDAKLLQALSTELIDEEDIQGLYERIVDAAVTIMRSDFGSMQMLYPERGAGGELRLLATRGFDPEAVKFWEWVRADSGCTCGEALRTLKRAIASDVSSCGFMAGTEDRAACLRAGIHAGQSTPLVSRSGKPLGMISTHWRQPHEPTERDLRLLDILARQAASLLERKKSEEALRRAEQDLRDFVDNARIGMHRVGEDGKILWVNRAELEMLGYTREEYIGHHIAEFHEDGPVIEDILGRLTRGETLHEHGARLRCKDGSIREVVISSNVFREGGRFVHTRCFTRDVTDRKRAEEAARENEAGLREHAQTLETLNHVSTALSSELELEPLVQKALDAATVLSGAKFGAFFYNSVNDKGDAYLLYTLSGAPREAFEKFGMPRNTAVFAPTFAGEGVVRVDDVTKDPRYGKNAPHHGMPRGHLPVKSYLAVPVNSRSGKVLGGMFFGHPEPGVFTERAERLVTGIAAHAAVAIDNAHLLRRVHIELEDRKKAEAALGRVNATLEQRVAERTAMAEKRAGDLRSLATQVVQVEQRERKRLAMVLHDHLQQLLVAAQLRVSMTRREEDPLLREQSLDQIAELVMQSIQASRSLTVELSPPILHDGGLGAALEWLSRWMSEKHGLAVEVRVEESPPVEDEETRLLLFSAVRELLFNTAKHAGVRRALVTLGGNGEGQIWVKVEDEGVGFDPSTEKSAEGAEGGFGLFSIAQRVESFGGSMDVQSGPGLGTRVTLLMPVKHVPGLPTEPIPPGRAEGSRGADNGRRCIHVLLVDDHAIMRDGLALLLRQQPDLRVVAEASDGLEAIRLAGEHRPDVVVMDVNMPRMNGVEATRRIKAAMPEVKVIGLSMFTAEDMSASMHTAGADAYLSKDGASLTLSDTIRRVTA